MAKGAKKKKKGAPTRKRVGSKRPAKAKRAKKTKPAITPSPAAAGPPVLPVGVRAEFAATAAGCLDQEVATALVFSCTGVGPVDPATPLGTLFPSDVQRRGFCGCVFNKAFLAGADIGPSDIPCTATNSVGDVIDRISC